MVRHLTLALAVAAGLWIPALAQNSDHNNVDVHGSFDLHAGDDADAKKVGVPLYPGARLKQDDENHSRANLSLLTDAFGIKLVVAKYTSDDAPAKVVDYYRDKLKKYGKVLECHSHKHSGDVDVRDGKDSDDSKDNKALKCDENSGPVVELKVGTEDNQRVVAVEPGDANKGTSFAVVYVYTRGKRGDI